MALELSASVRSGSNHGIGRYITQLQLAATSRGYEVLPVVVPPRFGRMAEFIDVLERRRQLKQSDWDVFHATSAYSVAGPLRSKWIASILDCIPLDVRSHRQTGIKARVFYSIAARADVIVTLSQFSADRIATTLGVPHERIVVAPLPAGQAFTPRSPDPELDELTLKKLGVKAPYFFSMAHFAAADPRKRFEWLDGVAKGLQTTGYSLVVAGPATDAVPGGDNKLAVGHLADNELAVLYRNAYGFVYTSAYEGQGLPLLEAISCGVPVVGMSNTSIPEVVGQAGLLLKETRAPAVAAQGPHSAHDVDCQRLIDACRRLVDDPTLHDDLAKKARNQAKIFSAVRFAEAIDAAYQRVLK